MKDAREDTSIYWKWVPLRSVIMFLIETRVVSKIKMFSKEEEVERRVIWGIEIIHSMSSKDVGRRDEVD